MGVGGSSAEGRLVLRPTLWRRFTALLDGESRWAITPLVVGMLCGVLLLTRTAPLLGVAFGLASAAVLLVGASRVGFSVYPGELVIGTGFHTQVIERDEVASVDVEVIYDEGPTPPGYRLMVTTTRPSADGQLEQIPVPVTETSDRDAVRELALATIRVLTSVGAPSLDRGTPPSVESVSLN